MEAIRILVVDDHAAVRRGICTLLNAYPDMNVVGEASRGLEAIQKAEELQPDILLLDISMPELNGLQVAQVVKKVAPKLEILIVTQFDNPSFVREAFSAGALGFLNKTDLAKELVAGIREVYAKRRFVSKTVSGAILPDPAVKPSISSDSSSAAKKNDPPVDNGV